MFVGCLTGLAHRRLVSVPHVALKDFFACSHVVVIIITTTTVIMMTITIIMMMIMIIIIA